MARGDQPSKAGFPGSKLQNEEASSGSKSNQKCIDGIKSHPAKKCYIFNKQLYLEGWKVQGKYAKDILEALEADKTLKKRYGIAYKELIAGNMEKTEPIKDIMVNYRSTFTPETDLFVPTNLYTSFTI